MKYNKGIKLARTVRGLSQKRLAREAGLDPSYISLLESGTRTPSAATIESIAEALRIPPHLMLLLSSEKNDLKNISEDEAAKAGNSLLMLLLEAEAV